MFGELSREVILVNEPSGAFGYLDYRNLNPMNLRPAMLAHGMAGVVRFKGFTSRPIPLTEHSLRVGRFAAELAAPGSKSVARFWGLLHDTHEVLTPWGDCPSPWKTEEMKAIESSIDPLIWEAMRLHGIVHWEIADFAMAVSQEIRDVVRRADMAALYYEATLWQPGGTDWAKPTADVGDRLLPGVLPRPGEDWMTVLKVAGNRVGRG